MSAVVREGKAARQLHLAALNYANALHHACTAADKHLSGRADLELTRATQLLHERAEEWVSAKRGGR